MSKANDHPVTVILRDWTKTNKANSPVIAERLDADWWFARSIWNWVIWNPKQGRMSTIINQCPCCVNNSGHNRKEYIK